MKYFPHNGVGPRIVSRNGKLIDYGVAPLSWSAPEMSYDISLVDEEGAVLELPGPAPEGGTYSPGSRQAWLNVTYNYGGHFYRVVDHAQGIRWLYGRRAADTIAALTAAIDRLTPDDDPPGYWVATEGNARKALEALRAMAEQLPHGSWKGD